MRVPLKGRAGAEADGGCPNHDPHGATHCVSAAPAPHRELSAPVSGGGVKITRDDACTVFSTDPGHAKCSMKGSDN